MSIDDITVEGVSNLLANLQGHKAHGPDNITARLLQSTLLLYLLLFLRVLSINVLFLKTGNQLMFFQSLGRKVLVSS